MRSDNAAIAGDRARRRPVAAPRRSAAARRCAALLLSVAALTACESDGGDSASFIGGTITPSSSVPSGPDASATSRAGAASPTIGPPSATATTPGPDPASQTTAPEQPSDQPSFSGTSPAPPATPATSIALPTPSNLSTADETVVPDGKAVCDAVSPEELQAIFGAPVATKPDRALASCEFSGGGAQMAVSLYDADNDGLFTIEGQKAAEDGGHDLVIAGHPAVLTGDDNLCVSRADVGSTGGILKIYGLWDEQEVEIGKRLAEKIIPHFTVGVAS